MIETKDGTDEEKIAGMTSLIIDEIRKYREQGKTWEQITEQIIGDMEYRATVPYIIYHSQKCGYPDGCDELATVAFLHTTGVVFVCKEHYREAEAKLYG